MKTVIVAGALANKPGNGGNVWAVLNWVLGLRRLGLRAYFVEQIRRDRCIDGADAAMPITASTSGAYFRAVMARFGLAAASALLLESGEQSIGLGYRDLLDVAGEADLLINISGHLTLEPILSRIRHRAFLDLDPGYTQFWHSAGLPGARLAGHHSYFTIGEHIGTAASTIPTCGISWRHTRPPIVLDLCPVAPSSGPERFTTVASWRGAYGPVYHAGRSYGQKVHEFRKFLPLPKQSPGVFEIALDIHQDEIRDLAALAEAGWRIADPAMVAADPDDFHRYVQTSDAEFSAAQGIYVETESGWFSDRTIRYLASGKPAVVQDTGFSRCLPTGEGLLPFSTLAEAGEAVSRLNEDYRGHRQAARALAETYFDSDRVLGRFLEQVRNAAA
jgi:hypothetical protein